MKTRNILLLLCICLTAVAALVYAADDAEETSAPAPQRMQRPAPGRGPAAAQDPRGRGPIAEPGQRGRGPAGDPNVPTGREDALRNAMAQRMQMHQQEIAKLDAIVKIAEGENAEKTVEALKALIAEKNKEVRDQVEQAERRRQEMQQRLQERLGERATERPEGQRPAGAGQVRPEDRFPMRQQGQPAQGPRGRQAPQED